MKRKKTPNSEEILHKSDSLSNIFQKSQCLKKMDHLLTSILPLELQAECHVANYRDHTLILHVTSAAWTTRLRLLLPNLLKRLRLVDAFSELEKIDIKVRPNTTTPQPHLESAQLSSYGEKVLTELKEQLIDDGKKY